MDHNMKLTQQKLRELLDYDPETGWFKSKRTGLKIGFQINQFGHTGIWLAGRNVLAHRMAWLYVNGETPRAIDHINGHPSDNRLANLRPASPAQNRANSKANRNSKSGTKGVSPSRTGRRWRARISINKKTVHLGTFPTKEEANAAYMLAASRHYGEFARAA
jgi:hypothetical protein